MLRSVDHFQQILSFWLNCWIVCLRLCTWLMGFQLQREKQTKQQCFISGMFFPTCNFYILHSELDCTASQEISFFWNCEAYFALLFAMKVLEQGVCENDFPNIRISWTIQCLSVGDFHLATILLHLCKRNNLW